jgi:hypothetical protein
MSEPEVVGQLFDQGGKVRVIFSILHTISVVIYAAHQILLEQWNQNSCRLLEARMGM